MCWCMMGGGEHMLVQHTHTHKLTIRPATLTARQKSTHTIGVHADMCTHACLCGDKSVIYIYKV